MKKRLEKLIIRILKQHPTACAVIVVMIFQMIAFRIIAGWWPLPF